MCIKLVKPISLTIFDWLHFNANVKPSHIIPLIAEWAYMLEGLDPFLELVKK